MIFFIYIDNFFDKLKYWKKSPLTIWTQHTTNLLEKNSLSVHTRFEISANKHSDNFTSQVWLSCFCVLCIVVCLPKSKLNSLHRVVRFNLSFSGEDNLNWFNWYNGRIVFAIAFPGCYFLVNITLFLSLPPPFSRHVDLEEHSTNCITLLYYHNLMTVIE